MSGRKRHSGSRAGSRSPAKPTEQLAFDLALEPRFGAEDFLVSASNEQAYGLIEAWPNWPDQIVALIGQQGSGKSHLAAIWATNAHAWTLDAAQVSMERVPYLLSNRALVIEDIDRGTRDDAALFHLLNLAREQKAFVLITASSPPSSWSIATADLLSRLRLAPSVVIDPPDDALLKAVLVKLFVDRQLVVDTQVVDSLALRIDRSLAMAGDVVAALDRAALQRGRRITRHLAMQVVEEIDTMRDEAEQQDADSTGGTAES
jgi:chromosomal replication initiation ATPase DnaA